MRTLLLLALAGCAGGSDAPAPAPATAKPAGTPPATPAPPPAAVAVGPDGPDALAVPDFVLATDAATVAAGQAVFDAKGCGACHKFGEKLVGPDLSGIAERRSPKWIGRMVLHPAEMVKQDPVAKGLFRELMVEMPNQGVSDAELPALVGFLASHPSAK